MTIYLESLMDHYTLPRNWGRLKAPTHSARVANPLCGDVIDLDLLIVDGQLLQVAFVSEGCAICRAAMSQLSEAIKLQPIDRLPYIQGTELVDQLLNISLTPTRLKCALLARDAVLTALNPARQKLSTTERVDS